MQICGELIRLKRRELCVIPQSREPVRSMRALSNRISGIGDEYRGMVGIENPPGQKVGGFFFSETGSHHVTIQER